MRASRSSSSRTSLSDSAISTPEPALRAHDVDGITRVSQPTWKIELTEAELPFLAGKPSNFVSLRDVVLLVEVSPPRTRRSATLMLGVLTKSISYLMQGPKAKV